MSDMYVQSSSLILHCKMFLSKIGVILRDSHGVAQVRYITGNKILRILKAKGIFVYCLVKNSQISANGHLLLQIPLLSKEQSNLC